MDPVLIVLSIYFGITFFVVLALIMVGWLIRLTNWSIKTRRGILVALAVLSVSPMEVPVGLISGWAPNILLLLAGGLDLGYYISHAQYAVPSFAITGVLAWLVVRWWVKDDASFLPTKTLKTLPAIMRVVIPVSVLVIVVSLYNYYFPSYDIPSSFSRDTVEEPYGELLDRTIALYYMKDEAQRETTINELRVQFQKDPLVRRVKLVFRDVVNHTTDDIFRFERKPVGDEQINTGGSSCRQAHRDKETGLWRCMLSGGLYVTKLLRYRQEYGYEDRPLELSIYFYYDAFLDSYGG